MLALGSDNTLYYGLVLSIFGFPWVSAHTHRSVDEYSCPPTPRDVLTQVTMTVTVTNDFDADCV